MLVRKLNIEREGEYQSKLEYHESLFDAFRTEPEFFGDERKLNLVIFFSERLQFLLTALSRIASKIIINLAFLSVRSFLIEIILLYVIYKPLILLNIVHILLSLFELSPF